MITGGVTLLLVGPWLVWLAGVDPAERRVLDRLVGRPAAGPDRLLGLPDPVRVDPAAGGHRCRDRAAVPRRPDGPRPHGAPGRWSPRPPEGGLLLIAWWVVPWVLAVLYQPSWPLEDALRPQRLWLIASQPGLILAAIGLVALVEAIVAAPRSRIRRAAPLASSSSWSRRVPVTVATTRLLASTWTEPIYAHLRPRPDRVPDFAALLPSHPPRPTVLTYEDWSSLAWYETGVGVVAVVPPGYAKLASTRRCSRSQPGRPSVRPRAAFRGDPAVLVATADRYGADRIVLARRARRPDWLSQPAALAAAAGGVTGAPRSSMAMAGMPWRSTRARR